MTDDKKVHPLRRRRRGKRGGKKHRRVLAIALTPPTALLSLRSRLTQLATKKAG